PGLDQRPFLDGDGVAQVRGQWLPLALVVDRGERHVPDREMRRPGSTHWRAAGRMRREPESLVRTLLLILLLTAPTLARAQYYEEHHAVSLLAGPGFGYTNSIHGSQAQTGAGLLLDVGGSLTVGYAQ